MKDVKIGRLIFKPRAIRNIAFCLFFNGIIIGLMVAHKQVTGASMSILIINPLMFLPYIFFWKEIRKYMIEEVD
jgi:hypothetical protein